MLLKPRARKTRNGGCKKFLVLFAAEVVILCNNGFASASIDCAQIDSSYFSTQSTVGADEVSSSGYAKRWAGWLKLYRAIQESPELRKQYGHKPAHDGAAFYKLSRRISVAQLRAQSSHVYVLQIATFRS